MARTKRPRKRKNKNTGNISAISMLLVRTNKLIDQNNDSVFKGRKAVSNDTKRCRRYRITNGMKEIVEAGYEIRSPYQLKNKHVVAVVRRMEERNLSPSTISTTLSAFRAVCVWINKDEMIGKTKDYVSDPGNFCVPFAATVDKSWDGNGFDVQALIQEVTDINPLSGMVLETMSAFGLRLREAVLLKPHIAAKSHYVDIYDGTKGKRSRRVPIETDYQCDVLNRTCKMVSRKYGNLSVDDIKLGSWIRKCYRVFEKVGITRKNGITPHGLRHQYLQDKYESIAQAKAPIKRGATDPMPDPLLHYLALKETAECAGHSRPGVSTGYVGSIDPRVVARKAREESLKKLADN